MTMSMITDTGNMYVLDITHGQHGSGCLVYLQLIY